MTVFDYLIQEYSMLLCGMLGFVLALGVCVFVAKFSTDSALRQLGEERFNG